MLGAIFSCWVIYLESWLDHTISFKGRDHDIEHPEEDEDGWWDCLEELGAAELASNSGVSSGQQDEDSQGGFNTEDGDRETQAARNTLVLVPSASASSVKPSNGNDEFFSLSFPVDGSHGPGDTNTQEHVDSIGAGHISNRVVSSIVLNSGGLGGKRV